LAIHVRYRMRSHDAIVLKNCSRCTTFQWAASASADEAILPAPAERPQGGGRGARGPGRWRAGGRIVHGGRGWDGL